MTVLLRARRMALGVLAALSLLCLPGGGARGEIALRVGVHPDFGRIVIVPPARLAYALTRQGDALKLRMAGGGGFGKPNRLPPAVTGIDRAGDALTLALASGAIARVWRDGSRLILDIYPAGVTIPADGLDAQVLGPPAQAAAKAPPAAKGAAATTKPAAAPAAVPALPAAPATAAGPPEPAGASLPARPVTNAAGPVSPSGLIATALPGGALLPFPAEAGAAAFRRGEWGLVVVDQPKPLDLSGLRDDPLFGGARLTLLPDATVLAVKLGADRDLVLTRRPEGWAVTGGPAGSLGAAGLRPVGEAGVVSIPARAPGAVVAIEDPETGGKLLVGTLREGGPGLALGYRSPEVALLPSWSGLAVEPRSDRVSLRTVADGFRLSAEGGPPLAVALNGGAAALEDGGRLSRQFDFAALPLSELRARLQEQTLAEAEAPRLGRFPARLAVARTMLGLGLDREALAMLRLAVADEPEEAGNGEVAELAAMAAWLAGIADSGLGAPPAPGTDETALWHALEGGGNAAGRAAAVAPRWRLLLGYPVPLRHRLLPEAAAVLEAGGRLGDLQALFAASGDPALALARARALRDAGETEAALAAFDALARGRDRKAASSAMGDAVALRLATSRIDAKAAASLLDRHLYDWRGDETELALRLRLAALRAGAGEPRAALTLLQQTETVFPDARARVRDAERDVVARLLRPGEAAQVNAIDLVAIAEMSAGLLTESEAGSALAPALVDKLLALDLPDRAAPILERMLEGAKPGAARAELGLRLASIRLDRGDAAAARAALDGSDGPGLEATLAERRGVMLARALAAGGDAAGALSRLAAIDSEDSLLLQAKLRSGQQDWAGAEQALQALVAKRIPAGAAPLDAAQQALVLQLAGAASNAQDMAGLRELRAEQANRMPAGANADLFRVLTAAPVSNPADLPRAAAESAAARQAIAGLEAR